VILVSALLALSMAATPPPTRELSTPRFRIVYTERAAGSAQVLARELEPMRDEVAGLLGRDWPGVTEVRVGFDHDEYEALALPGGPPPEWAIALAYPRLNIVLFEAHSLTRPEGSQTLKHELVHVALGQLGGDFPRWFQEGMAMELTGERKWQLEQVATLTRAVTQNLVYEFEELTDGFPHSADSVEIAYAQSAAFVEFLRARHGSAAFNRLIERVAQGDNFEKAFGIAFYVPLSMEQDAFKRELPKRYPWWPLLLSGGTIVWALLSVLLTVGWVRRRREVRILRARQLQLEIQYELFKAMMFRPIANDDITLEELLPVRGPRAWRVESVRE
jgi:hypothetical protein